MNVIGELTNSIDEKITFCISIDLRIDLNTIIQDWCKEVKISESEAMHFLGYPVFWMIGKIVSYNDMKSSLFNIVCDVP